MTINPRIYMDACCFVDVAKYSLERRDSIASLADKEDHITFCIKLLRAAKEGEVAIFTSSLTVAECQHVGEIPPTDEQKRLIGSILTSGKVVTLVPDSLFIAENARDLLWKHGIGLRGADAIHVASALEAKCSELITTDNAISRFVEAIEKLGLAVIRADKTKLLPAAYLVEQVPLFPEPAGSNKAAKSADSSPED